MTVINDDNKRLLHKNKITVLDFYFEKLNMVLWPRFTQLIDIYTENIKKTNYANFKLYNQTTVHASTMKYAELVRSLYKLAPHLSQDMLGLRLGQLRTLFIEFIYKLGQHHLPEDNDKRSFNINNLDCIITVLKTI
jgi:vacuolar protein sorting-associated protein 52